MRCVSYMAATLMCVLGIDAYLYVLHAGGSRDLCVTPLLDKTDACRKVSDLTSLLTMPSFDIGGKQHDPVSVDWTFRYALLCA